MRNKASRAKLKLLGLDEVFQELLPCLLRCDLGDLFVAVRVQKHF